MLTEHCIPPDFPRAEPETHSVELKSGELSARELAADLRRMADEIEAFRATLRRAFE
jgi:hypothetical protein